MKKILQKESGKFKSHDGTSIYYEVRGEGEPILLVYGLACLINHWHFQIEYLSQKFKVITFDLRGHHQSAVPEFKEQLSLEAVAKDIPYLFRELGVKKAHFVGHSLGGQVLLKTYSLSPEIFKSITFINGFAKNPIKGMFGLDVIEPFFYFIKSLYEKNPNTIDLFWKKLIDNPISMIGAALAGGFNLKLTQFKDIEIYAHGVSQISLSVFIPYFEDMMAFDGQQIAPQITVPAFIISGDRDNVTPEKFQKELHESIINSHFLRIPYGSHCCQLDFPEYVNLKIEKFIDEIN